MDPNAQINYQDYLNRMAQSRQELSQRVASAPNVAEDLRRMIYGDDQVLPGLRRQRTEKIQELWDHDKRLAETYADPASDVYLNDPYAREKARALQAKGTVGEIGDLDSLIQGREDILGDALTRGLKVFEAGTRAKEIEYKGLMDELNAALKIQNAMSKKISGGAGGGAGGIGAPGSLTDLYNTILGVKGSYEELANVFEQEIPAPPAGMPITDHILQQIPDIPDGETVWETLPSGRLKVSVRPGSGDEGYQYEDYRFEGDVNDIISQLGAATTSVMPDERNTIQDIVDYLQFPQFGTSQAEQRAGVAGRIRAPQLEEEYTQRLRSEKSGLGAFFDGLGGQDVTPAGPAPAETTEAPSGYSERLQQIANDVVSGRMTYQEAVSTLAAEFPGVATVIEDLNRIYINTVQ